MDNENTIGNVASIESEDGSLKIKAESSYYSENFYFADIFDEKMFKNFIKNTEKLIRTSKEYFSYIASLRSEISALNCDNILSNITSSDASLEFHHYPFSLFDIVDIVACSKLISKKQFTSFSLAKEIMNLHFDNLIGLVPLSKTTHELAHKGHLFFSTKQIYGKYKKFIDRYSNGISVDLKNKIKNLESSTASKSASDFEGIL